VSCTPEAQSPLIDKARRQYYPQIVLEETIDFDGLQILLTNGLSKRCCDVYERWQRQRDHDEAQFSQEEEGATSRIHEEVMTIYRRLEAGLAEWLAGQTVEVYP